MPSALHRLLGLEPGDLSPLWRLATVHALIGAGIAAGDAAVQTVFVSRVGAEHLPEVLAIRALASPALAWVYALASRGRTARGVLSVLGPLLGAAEVGALLALTIGGPGITAAYVIHEIVVSLVTVHWGVVLLAHVSGGRALRGVALVYTAARFGGVVAGALLVPVMTSFGAEAGMMVAAGAFALLTPAALALPTQTIDPSSERESLDDAPAPEDALRPTAAPERRAGFRLLGRSPLLLAFAFATTAIVLTRFALRYQQQEMLESLPEVELAAMLAFYTIAANGLGLLLSLFVVGRLLARVGLARANGAYAAAALGAQVVLLLVPGIGAALVARFADGELKHVLKTPISSLLYEAFEPGDRAAARALVLGVISPAAQVLAAAALAGLVAGAPAWAAVAGLSACALLAVATVVQNRGYARAVGGGSTGHKP